MEVESSTSFDDSEIILTEVRCGKESLLKDEDCCDIHTDRGGKKVKNLQISSINTDCTKNCSRKPCIIPREPLKSRKTVNDGICGSRRKNSLVFLRERDNDLWTKLREMMLAQKSVEKDKRTRNGGIFCLCTQSEQSPESSKSDPYGTNSFTASYHIDNSSPKSLRRDDSLKEFKSPDIDGATSTSAMNSFEKKTVKRNNLKRCDNSNSALSPEMFLLNEIPPTLDASNIPQEDISYCDNSNEVKRNRNDHHQGFDRGNNHYDKVEHVLERAVSSVKTTTKPESIESQGMETKIKNAKSSMYTIPPVRGKRESTIFSPSPSSLQQRTNKSQSFATCISMETEEVSRKSKER